MKKVFTMFEYAKGKTVTAPAGSEVCEGDVDDPWEQKKAALAAGKSKADIQVFFNTMVDTMESLVGPIVDKAKAQGALSLT